MSQQPPQQQQQARSAQPQAAQTGAAGQPAAAPAAGQQAEPGIQVQGGEELSQAEHEQVQRATRRIQQTRQQVGQTAAGGQQAAPFFQTTNFLADDVRAASAQALNQVLVDATVVVSQIYSAHWNVRGPEFYQLHELFEDVAEEIEPHLDEIAERVTALGGTARGTVQQAARQTTVPEMPANVVSGQDLLEHVAQTLSAFDAQLYRAMEATESRGDLDTVDLLNEISRKVSKGLWFVEAHLQGPWPEPQRGGWKAGQQGAQSSQ